MHASVVGHALSIPSTYGVCTQASNASIPRERTPLEMRWSVSPVRVGDARQQFAFLLLNPHKTPHIRRAHAHTWVLSTADQD